MFLIVALVIVAIMLLIALVTIGIYAAIGLKRSIASVLSVVASAIAAAVATVVICSPQLPVLPAIIDFAVEKALEAIPAGMLPEDVMALVISAINLEAIGAAAEHYISMLIAPFVFVLLFVPIAIIATIIISVIVSFIPVMKKLPKAAHHLGGAAVGVVCGLLVAILCVFPLVGVADIAESAYDDIAEIEVVQSVVEAIPVDVDFEVMGAFDYIGCGPLYDFFSSASVNGEMTNLKTEVGVLVDIAIDALPMIENSSSLDAEQVDSIKGIVASLDNSPILKNIVVDVVSFAIDSELLSFDLGDMINPLVDATIDVIATSTKDTIANDLNTLVNVLGIVVESGILEENDSQAILNKISDGLASDLLVEINKNERMYPVADEITNLSIRALASTLGIPADADERYNNLMNKIADELNNTAHLEETERFELLKKNLDAIFSDYGVEVKGEALDHVTEGLMSDLKGHVSGTAVKEFFMLYHSGEVMDDPSAKAEDGVEYLTSGSDSEIVVNADGTISINGVVLEYYNASNYKNSQAVILGSQHVSFGDAKTLYSAKTVKSTVVTAEDLLAGMGHYGSCADAIAESEKVGEIFKMITGIVAGKDLDNLDGMEIFEELGPVFDKMQQSEIFNSASAQSMLTAILQSEKVSSVLGLSMKDMTNFADKINSYASDKETGYEDATKAISGTVNAVTKATDKNATEEEKVEATKNMIDNVSKDNAEMISSMLTDSMIEKFGGSTTGNTENATSAVTNLINNMADYKEESPDDESVAKEAEAVTKLITIATTGSTDEPLFDTADGDKGTLAADPQSFISTVVESSVVMATVNQSVDGQEAGSNPYGITYGSEEEKEEVASALENYYAENGGGEELAEKLNNLAIIMDVEINLNLGDLIPDGDVDTLPDIDVDNLPDLDLGE